MPGATDEVSAGRVLRDRLSAPDTDVRHLPRWDPGAIVHPAHLDDDEVFERLKQPLYVSLAG